MLKVFNRGNKSNLTDCHVPEPTPQTSNYRRQASLRHSHYFGHTEHYATLGSLKQGGKANLINSKKYISCENVRQSIEEYQDVIDEDSSDDENGIKEKIAKRYNSLTTLLMKSFRKAKIKKKKEAMLNDSIRSEIYHEKSTASPKLNAEQRSSLRPNETPMLPPRHENSKKNKPTDISGQTNATLSRSQPVSKKNFIHQDNCLSSSETNKKNEESQSSDHDENPDGSVPVFLGVKMISNEFVDLKPAAKTSQTKIDSSSRSSELTFDTILEKKTENQNVEKKLDISQNESNFSTQVSQLNGINELKKVSDSPKFAISSINKPQAPKAPVQSEKIDEKSSPIEARSLSLKRAKTFTQQLQEILLERKRNSVQSEQVKLNSTAESELENNQSNAKLFDNKSLGYYDTINSTKSIYQDIDDSNYIKQIKNFNESSMLKDISQLSISNYSNDDSSDDFKDLVQVLARQDNLFKRKFFDCLMTKLWDTTLPYNEYLQLNKLMSALFGENYHKLDTSYLSSCSQNRANKLNSEQVVNLVKIFLDSSSSEKSSNVQNEDLNFEYFSVANLISTLKRRQKNEPLSLEVQNFNANFEKLLSPENKNTQKKEEDLDFERIQFLNGINSVQNSSAKVKIYEPESGQKIAQNEVNYFARNRFRSTMGNFDSLLAQYSCGPPRPIQKILADSSASFQSVKYCTLQRDETRPNVSKSIVLNTPVKSSGIIASFQPSQDSKRNQSREIQPTFVASKVINLNKQYPPKPKISNCEKEAINAKMNNIRSVRELFKNDENSTNFPKKNEIAMVKTENLVYAQFDNKKSVATLPSKKTLMSCSVDSKTMNKPILSPYTNAKKLQLPGIYSTLGPKKDAGDIIYYHPNQFKLNGFEKSNQIVSNRLSKDSRIYESKSTKNYQLTGIIADKIYKNNPREMNQAYY